MAHWYYSNLGLPWLGLYMYHFTNNVPCKMIATWVPNVNQSAHIPALKKRKHKKETCFSISNLLITSHISTQIPSGAHLGTMAVAWSWPKLVWGASAITQTVPSSWSEKKSHLYCLVPVHSWAHIWLKSDDLLERTVSNGFHYPNFLIKSQNHLYYIFR